MCISVISKRYQIKYVLVLFVICLCLLSMICSKSAVAVSDIEILSITMASDRNGNQWVKDNDFIELSFQITDSGSNVILDTITATLAGKSHREVKHIGNGVYVAVFSVGDFDVNHNAFIIPLGSIVSVVAIDEDNNTFTKNGTISSDLRYFEDIIISGLRIETDNNNKALAKDGDTIYIHFSTNKNITVISSTIANKPATATNTTGNEWVISYQITSGDLQDNTIISFSITVRGNKGMEITIEPDSVDYPVIGSVTYYAPIVINDLVFTTSNSSVYVKNDDVITLQFYTTHPVDIEPVIAGQIITNISSQNDEKMVWTIKYTVTGGHISDNELVSFSLSVTDDAGNTPVTKTQNDVLNSIIYIAPVSIIEISFLSNNFISSLAKDGDIITITFKTDKVAAVSNAVIAGVTVTPVSTDNINWILQHTIQNGVITDNGDISFKITLIEATAGNTTIITEENTNKVVYYAPIEIHNLRFISNNSVNNTRVRDNNTLTLSFNTTHPVNINNATIAGKPVTISSVNNDNKTWVATYIVSNGDIEDMEYVGFNFTATDDAGNTDVYISETDSTPVRYYAPIMVTDINIVTNNINDGNRFAKDGDRITVSFKTNHETNLSNVRIAGVVVEPNNMTRTIISGSLINDWSISYVLANGNLIDLSEVTFSIDITDAAGNSVSISNNTSGVKNRIQYFSPIIATVAIRSDGENPAYAKNGTGVSISINTNHNTFITQSSIYNRQTVNTGNNTANLNVSYTISEDETEIPEGLTQYDVRITDSAGNILLLSENDETVNTSVIYDRTPPTVRIEPDLSGFINTDVPFSVIFYDSNPDGLDVDRISVLLNSVEQVTEEERLQTVGNQSLTKTIDCREEGSYTIRASIIDLAGNEAQHGAAVGITIIKSGTNITSTMINIGNTTPQVFKSGLILSEFFNISSSTVDENGLPFIKDIICVVNEDNNWDFNMPLIDEGRKTINLTIIDMADNTTSLTYELYIRSTPPIPIIKNNDTGGIIAVDSNQNFNSSFILSIGLSDIIVGNQAPDVFTNLLLTDEYGNTIIDILSSVTPNDSGEYIIPIREYGTYRIVAEATDSSLAVNEYDENGNKTGVMVYTFTYSESRNILTNPLFIIPTATVTIIAGAVLYRMYKTRKKLKAS